MGASNDATPFRCVFDSDGFIIHVSKPDSSNTSTTLKPQSDNSTGSSHNDCEPDLAGFEIDDENRVDVPERPVSRQSHYRGEKRRRLQITRIPPLPKVRRYPFILDGHPGLYTISQISRYADISPSRGTAMLLRRFRLLNEVLDRSQADGYKSCRPTFQPDDGEECDRNAKQHRWPGHGRSKLRNEVLLSDLVSDEDSEDELSFDPPSEYSFPSYLSNESFDFEAPMKTTSSVGDESGESSFGSGNQDILGPELAYTPRDPRLLSEELYRSRDGFPPTVANVCDVRA